MSTLDATTLLGLNGWEPLTESIGGLRGTQAALAEFVEQLFAQLEQRLAQLNEQEQQVADERDRLAQELAQVERERALRAEDLAGRHSTEAELTRSLDELRRQLGDSQAELQRVRAELADARVALASARQSSAEQLAQLEDQFTRQISLLDQRRAELERQVAAATAEAAGVRQTVAELEQKQQAWLALEKELTQRLSKAETCQPDQALSAQLEHLQRHSSELEADLRAAHAQAAELNQAVAERNRQLEDSESHLEQMVDRQAFELLENQLADASERHAADQQRIESLLEQLSRRAATAVDLAGAGAQLEAARNDVRQLRQELERSSGSENQLRSQLAECELERSALEAELETVRSRAVELTDNMATLKKQNGEQRARYDSELQELHELLAQQSDVLGAHASAALAGPTTAAARATVAVHAAEATSTSKAKPEDTVLDSLLTQFENLQKDRLRRRGK